MFAFKNDHSTSLELKYNLIMKIYNLAFYVNKLSHVRKKWLAVSVHSVYIFLSSKRIVKIGRLILWAQNLMCQMYLLFKHKVRKADVRNNSKCWSDLLIRNLKVVKENVEMSLFLIAKAGHELLVLLLLLCEFWNDMCDSRHSVTSTTKKSQGCERHLLKSTIFLHNTSIMSHLM